MSILFEKVIKTYQKAVLREVTLDFAEGKINALLGESGRGKTTVLRLLAGLEQPDSGTVKVSGRVAYLFQEPRLLPALCALDNVRVVLSGIGADERALEALRICRASHLAAKKPSEMSGGEKQRVALARMLAFGGEIVLLDEPFSALDAATKAEIVGELFPALAGKTVIMVTHSEQDASLADKTILL